MIQSEISGELTAAPGADSMTLTRTPSRLVGVAAAVYREHKVVLGLALGYIAIGGLALTTLDREWPIEITNGPFAIVWTVLSMLWLCWQYLQSPKRLRRALVAPRVLGAILVALLVLPTQITLQSLKQSIGPVIGFSADPFLHRLDVLLHGQAAWLWLEPILARPWLVKSIDMLYMAWFLGLFVFVLWASWSRHRGLRQRALIAFLLLWIAGGTIMAGLAPSAGPCYYGQVVAGVDPYDKLITRLDSIGTEHGELRARFNQRMLWETRRADRWKHFAGIAAMPSLHVGVSVLFVLVAWPMSRLLGSLLALYAVAIQIGSVVLAWHYAVDGYLGAMFAIGSWTVAGLLPRKAQQGAGNTHTEKLDRTCRPSVICPRHVPAGAASSIAIDQITPVKSVFMACLPRGRILHFPWRNEFSTTPRFPALRRRQSRHEGPARHGRARGRESGQGPDHR